MDMLGWVVCDSNPTLTLVPMNFKFEFDLNYIKPDEV